MKGVSSDSQWLELQKRLGRAGRLGIAARVFNASRELECDIAFNADDAFPMASTAKIAIAMLAASRIASGQLALDGQVRIDSRLLSPGLPRSPLDHLFFYPFEKRRSETVDRLLGFMIHKSDNTASDVLSERLGGIPALAAFLEELEIEGMRFKRSFAQLVSFYYGLQLPPDRRPHLGQILAAIHRLRHPYVCRETAEDALIDSGGDCCTPRAMAHLLTALATQPKYSLAYSYMKDCAGGRNRIRRALADYAHLIQTFGHKTGSLGGVANDAGLVEFVDGSFAVICIMTCRASAAMEVRDEQIAAASRIIVAEAVRRVGRPEAESR